MEYDGGTNLSDNRDVPSGAIFMSNRLTMKECLRRKLFGLPSNLEGFVKEIKAGMILFLFEFEERKLYGVFEAACDGALNIIPHAFRSSGKLFPAQVSFKQLWSCHPLTESEFKFAIKDNYVTSKKFTFSLSEEQVVDLLHMFESRKIRTKKSRNFKCTNTNLEFEESLRPGFELSLNHVQCPKRKHNMEVDMSSMKSQGFSHLNRNDMVYNSELCLDRYDSSSGISSKSQQISCHPQTSQNRDVYSQSEGEHTFFRNPIGNPLQGYDGSRIIPEFQHKQPSQPFNALDNVLSSRQAFTSVTNPIGNPLQGYEGSHIIPDFQHNQPSQPFNALDNVLSSRPASTSVTNKIMGRQIQNHMYPCHRDPASKIAVSGSAEAHKDYPFMQASASQTDNEMRGYLSQNDLYKCHQDSIISQKTEQQPLRIFDNADSDNGLISYYQKPSSSQLLSSNNRSSERKPTVIDLENYYGQSIIDQYIPCAPSIIENQENIGLPQRESSVFLNNSGHLPFQSCSNMLQSRDDSREHQYFDHINNKSPIASFDHFDVNTNLKKAFYHKRGAFDTNTNLENTHYHKKDVPITHGNIKFLKSFGSPPTKSSFFLNHNGQLPSQTCSNMLQFRDDSRGQRYWNSVNNKSPLVMSDDDFDVNTNSKNAYFHNSDDDYDYGSVCSMPEPECYPTDLNTFRSSKTKKRKSVFSRLSSSGENLQLKVDSVAEDDTDLSLGQLISHLAKQKANWRKNESSNCKTAAGGSQLSKNKGYKFQNSAIGRQLHVDVQIKKETSKHQTEDDGRQPVNIHLELPQHTASMNDDLYGKGIVQEEYSGQPFDNYKLNSQTEEFGKEPEKINNLFFNFKRRSETQNASKGQKATGDECSLEKHKRRKLIRPSFCSDLCNDDKNSYIESSYSTLVTDTDDAKPIIISQYQGEVVDIEVSLERSTHGSTLLLENNNHFIEDTPKSAIVEVSDSKNEHQVSLLVELENKDKDVTEVMEENGMKLDDVQENKNCCIEDSYSTLVKHTNENKKHCIEDTPKSAIVEVSDSKNEHQVSLLVELENKEKDVTEVMEENGMKLDDVQENKNCYIEDSYSTLVKHIDDANFISIE